MEKKKKLFTRGIRFTNEQWLAIEDVGRIEGVSASYVIRHAVDEFLRQAKSN